MLDSQVIEHPCDDEIDEIGYLLRPVIKPRRRRHHDSPRTREPQHVGEMNRAERSFTRNENQLSPFLQSDIRRPLDQRA